MQSLTMGWMSALHCLECRSHLGITLAQEDTCTGHLTVSIDNEIGQLMFIQSRYIKLYISICALLYQSQLWLTTKYTSFFNLFSNKTGKKIVVKIQILMENSDTNGNQLHMIWIFSYLKKKN